jgi:hypothetical protein
MQRGRLGEIKSTRCGRIVVILCRDAQRRVRWEIYPTAEVGATPDEWGS